MNSPRSRARSSDQVHNEENQPSIPELIRKESDEAFVVDIAETGERHIVQVVARGQDSYQFFSHKLELISGIPRASLIILAGPPFKSYNRGFPPKDSRVYLFDKRSLNTKGSKIIFQRMLVPPVSIPTKQAAPDQELEQLLARLQSTNLPPLHSTLPMYERHLKLHLEKAQVLVSHIRKVMTQCVNWSNARERHRGALEAALGNLEDHLSRTSEEYQSMASALIEQQKEGKRLLEGFDDAMAKLMKTPLHPAIAAIVGGDMVSSCIPHERYTPYVAQCRTSQERLSRSADDMQTLHTHLQQSVRDIEVNNNDHFIDIQSAKDMVAVAEKLLVVAEDLYKDVRNDVITTVTALLEPHDDPSGLLRSVLDEMEEKRMSAESDLVKLVEVDEALSAQCVEIAKMMDNGANEVRSKVTEISVIQKNIVNLQQHVKLRTEALKQQREDFVHLEMIHRLPDEVALFETEVKRRQRWQALFEKEVKSAQDHLSELYRQEVASREKYLHQHGHFLPPCFSTSVYPSIFQKPPRFRVDLAAEPVVLQLPDDSDQTSASDVAKYSMLSRKEAIEKCEELEKQLAVLRETAPPTYASVESEKSETEKDSNIHEKTIKIKEKQNNETDRISGSAAAGGGGGGGEIGASGGGGAEEEDEFKGILNRVSHDSEVESLLTMLEETLPVHVSGLADQRIKEILTRALAVVSESRTSSMISFRSFHPGNVVLFLPVYPKKDGEGSLLYLAFNEQCPRHYLNQESAELFKARNNNKFPHFIIGRIIMVDPMVAGAKGDPVNNPFDLAEGTEFHVIAIEPLEPRPLEPKPLEPKFIPIRD